jgi:restriction system protein
LVLTSGSDMTISPGFSRRRDDPVPPACPQCGKAMMSRMAHQGPRTGELFWGCTSFPACRGSREM